MIGAMFVNNFLEFRGWSNSRLHTADAITLPMVLAGGAGLLVFGVMVPSRERRKVRQAESPGE
jgi:hypothetical protein